MFIYYGIIFLSFYFFIKTYNISFVNINYMNPIELKLLISFNFIISFKANKVFIIFSDLYSISLLNIKSLNNSIFSKSEKI
ncbi:hypothetical protein SZ47_00185 [Brachyspira hyodysenteriae]|uniref:Uncharacterized protein n=1 Tax=Brachyspira hyodysenteriae ATCC 27164 TaxID=1266923 RepID=A0A3B6W594_BRAHO|nr:hypothetical protein BHYOB78_07925 [Brachyspira hyodysenteriae ATCC 27164]KLI25205.1 hypothetical protein SR30_07405 [Brachyspira hyodysenteriae]KLI29165.1 hypothetical protein SZ47_00185 [Brachyspira hyodysenteriae]KLI50815.1 hypothetical protein SZ41_01785 [Brachyspira hyodysenteriae]KLI53514.1 hypothetical protein SZ42_01355 [Brachyspira hyodysenteriae]